MGYERILTVIAALAGEPVDPEAHFGAVATGGHVTETPETIVPCRTGLDPDEVEGRRVICGSISLPEDHDNPGARRVDLAFAIARARSSLPAADPLVYLHGGPGSGNLAGPAFFADVFDAWRDTRDIVIFDQRAAGLSTRSAACRGALVANVADILTENTGAFLEACVTELTADPEIGLRHYNTLQNAYDVRAVMRGLGYDSYNIYGISYGTKLALEVMRSAPEGVRSVILDGVAPPWIPLYDTLATPLDDAMQALVAECAADPAGDGAYPELGTVLGDVLARARAGTLIGPDGEAVPPGAIIAMFERRADTASDRSITGYMPAMIYEFSRPDQPTPTIDLVYSSGFSLPRNAIQKVRDDAVLPSASAEAMADLALREAERLRGIEVELDITIIALRDAVRRARDLGPLAGLLDEQMSRAAAPITADPTRAPETARAFAAMLDGPASAAALTGFVQERFEPESTARLTALVAAMSEAEIAGVWRVATLSVTRTTIDATNMVDL